MIKTKKKQKTFSIQHQPYYTVLVTVVWTSVVRRGCPSSQIYILVCVRKPMSNELDLSALIS